MREKNEVDDVDWAAAAKHLQEEEDLYEGAGGMIMLTLRDLRSRFHLGERSKDLYLQIMELD